MSRFKVYSPEQAYLLPPSARDELGGKHLCFFVREAIERLDMSVFERSYGPEVGELCAPQLMLGVWLYAYALGIASARQVERRLVEDSPSFRGLKPSALSGSSIYNCMLEPPASSGSSICNCSIRRTKALRLEAEGPSGYNYPRYAVTVRAGLDPHSP
jgi:hypothetical protein